VGSNTGLDKEWTGYFRDRRPPSIKLLYWCMPNDMEWMEVEAPLDHMKELKIKYQSDFPLEIKSHFDFCMQKDAFTKSQVVKKDRFLSYLVGEAILGAVARKLKSSALDMTEPSQGALGEACSSVSLSSCTVVVILGARVNEKEVHVSVATFLKNSKSEMDASRDHVKEWRRVCEAINEILAEDPKINSLRWLTSKEAGSPGLRDL
jgi:hypothetical protein